MCTQHTHTTHIHSQTCTTHARTCIHTCTHNTRALTRTHVHSHTHVQSHPHPHAVADAHTIYTHSLMWTHAHHTHVHPQPRTPDTRTRALTPRGRPACAHCWHTAFPGTNRLRGGLCRFERKRTLGRGGGAGVPGGREELRLRRVPGWQGRVQGGWPGTGGGPRGGRAVSPRQSPGGAYKDGPAAPASTGAPRRQEHQQALEHHFGRSTTPEGGPPRKEHHPGRSITPEGAPASTQQVTRCERRKRESW